MKLVDAYGNFLANNVLTSPLIAKQVGMTDAGIYVAPRTSRYDLTTFVEYMMQDRIDMRFAKYPVQWIKSGCRIYHRRY